MIPSEHDGLNDDELGKLYSRVAELENKLPWRRRCFFVRFILGTGMKLSEAQHVRFCDVHLEYSLPIIFVQPLCYGTKPHFIQVAPEFAPMLRRYVFAKRNQHLHYYLFPGRKRVTCAERGTLSGYWRDLLKEARIKHRPINACVRSTVAVFESERLPSPQLAAVC